MGDNPQQPPVSCFIDTEADFVIDPATLPETRSWWPCSTSQKRSLVAIGYRQRLIGSWPPTLAWDQLSWLDGLRRPRGLQGTTVWRPNRGSPPHGHKCGRCDGHQGASLLSRARPLPVPRGSALPASLSDRRARDLAVTREEPARVLRRKAVPRCWTQPPRGEIAYRQPALRPRYRAGASSSPRP